MVISGFDFGQTTKLWDLAAHLNAPCKDLVTLATALIQGDGKALGLGLKGIPALLPDSVEGLENLLENDEGRKWLEEFLIGIDYSLHNLKGDTINIIKRICSWKDFDRECFDTLLEKHVQR